MSWHMINLRRPSIQFKWFENDLRSVNRTRTPWIIVTEHRHMFTSEAESSGKSQIRQILQLYLEPLYYQYHVDLNLFAHRHSYERSCAMYQKKCISNGITNVLIGMAEQNLDRDSYTPVEWSKYHDQQFGYTTIVANRTYLHFTYYHSNEDQIADEFSLQK